eukprot:3937548-Rhodomonas_salina.1
MRLRATCESGKAGGRGRGVVEVFCADASVSVLLGGAEVEARVCFLLHAPASDPIHHRFRRCHRHRHHRRRDHHHHHHVSCDCSVVYLPVPPSASPGRRHHHPATQASSFMQLIRYLVGMSRSAR